MTNITIRMKRKYTTWHRIDFLINIVIEINIGNFSWLTLMV